MKTVALTIAIAALVAGCNPHCGSNAECSPGELCSTSRDCISLCRASQTLPPPCGQNDACEADRVCVQLTDLKICVLPCWAQECSIACSN
jgi:hypothetical protein